MQILDLKMVKIEVPDSQTSNLEVLDPESPDFMNSNSRIHKSHEGKGLKMILIQDSNSCMGSYIIKGYFIS
jgi:hypothetical protein